MKIQTGAGWGKHGFGLPYFWTQKGTDHTYKDVQGGDAFTTNAICPPHVSTNAASKMHDCANVCKNENANPPY